MFSIGAMISTIVENKSKGKLNVNIKKIKNKENLNSHVLHVKSRKCCTLPSILLFSSLVHGGKLNTKNKLAG